MLMYRQGDVALVRVEALPTGAKEVEPEEEGRIVLAHGEVTGHAHAVAVAERPDVKEFTAEDLRFLMIGDRKAQVAHEEHYDQLVEPGVYEVRQQREYSPQEYSRPVFD
jgi:hypothetical protein